MKWFISLLIILVLMSALQIIWVRHHNRLLLVQLHALQQRHDELNERWGQLQLEQSTWSQQSRIEAIATQQLNMYLPTPSEIIIIEP
ncbi:MAG: cell division protein FtsL [Pseudomonadota bacterium]|nr:cell division protein FtsL [Pseudomonadota bacterium]